MLADWKVLKGAGRPAAPAGPGHDFVARPVEEVRQPMRAAERVIDLHAVLVRRFLRRPAGREIVVRHVAKRPGHEPGAIRHHPRASQRDVLLGDGAKPVGRNLIAREGVSYEARAVGIRTRSRRIVDHEQAALAIHPLREVAVVHLGRRHAQGQRIRRLVVPEAFVSDKEKRLVLTGVHVRDLDGSTQ